MMTTGIIIQTSMFSQGLPGHALDALGDKPLLGYLLERLERLEAPVKKIVASTPSAEDNIIEDYCEHVDVECFRPSAANVLERYYLCAIEYCFSDIVRLSASNPFSDIDELERLIELHRSSGADYTHSLGALPMGAGAEVFTFEALRRSYKKASKRVHFDDVNGYIRDKASLFKVSMLDVPEAKMSPELRLTVDTEEDLRRARFIMEHSGGTVTTERAIEVCSRFA
ncbi:MAG: cytidylyltransferase domain-containing protein [Thermodesulfobacteriota bacterium]